MVAQPASTPALSAADYLARERTSPDKHEYLDGDVMAMAGARAAHNLICANVIGELREALRGGPCRVYSSDMKLHVPASSAFVYPDVMVVCGHPQYLDEAQDVVLNPTVVVEVLSDSTEAYDRGRKFEIYQRVSSLRDYLLVSQTKKRVDHYTRHGDGWLLRVHEEGGSVRLESVGCDVSMEELYLKVWEEPPPSTSAG